MKDNSNGYEYHGLQPFNLQFDTRAEIEQGRTDFVRFILSEDYLTEESLTHFRNDTLQWLFRTIYHDEETPNESLFGEGLRRSNRSPLVEQVVTALRQRFNAGWC